MTKNTTSEVQYFDHRFPNFGFLEAKFGKKDLQPIIDEVYEMININFKNVDKSNSELVGHIKNEYKIKKTRNHLDHLVSPFCLEYDRIYNYLQNINLHYDNIDIELGTVWVNFQKQYEFNPVHWHKGVFSFVIWLDIPFKQSEELGLESVKDAAIHVPGNFQFLYQNTLGQICTHNIPADVDYNYRMIFFPAAMRHTVYPFFTSTGYRISLAGNYVIRK